MNITVIGAGNMARGIGSRFVEGGNAVTIVDTDAAKARTLASELSARKPGSAAVAALDAALANPVIVLALPFADARDFASANAAKLAGKIVVDITNPLNATYDGLVTAPGKSAAEEIADLLPKSHVVKAFNTTFAGTLVAGVVSGHKLDVLVAGDDAAAKKQLSVSSRLAASVALMLESSTAPGSSKDWVFSASRSRARLELASRAPGSSSPDFGAPSGLRVAAGSPYILGNRGKDCRQCLTPSLLKSPPSPLPLRPSIRACVSAMSI
jgi:predicted dinucleotide-binding enzyme